MQSNPLVTQTGGLFYGLIKSKQKATFKCFWSKSPLFYKSWLYNLASPKSSQAPNKLNDLSKAMWLIYSLWASPWASTLSIKMCSFLNSKLKTLAPQPTKIEDLLEKVQLENWFENY